MNKVAVPFAVSGPAQAAATAALDHTAAVTERCRAVAAERERVRHRLLKAGLSVPPSRASFLWVAMNGRSQGFSEFCADRGVLVRRFGEEGVRVTIAAREHNDVFLRAAEEYAVTG